MCGITGLWRFGGAPEQALREKTRAMSDAISYRGPDGDGYWCDARTGVAFGHRRLAIIDLTPTGAQPMASADGNIVITYNGELYNTAEIAAELAMRFRGTSDTEVLVESIAHFGIEGALRRANGLFAFAAFDKKKNVLHLVRDRLGIKPLYWTLQDGQFAFASELKALRVVKDFCFEIDPAAVATYLRHACVPAPGSIYRKVGKLLPGQRLEIAAGEVRAYTYWDLREIARAGQAQPNLRPDEDVTDELEELLADSVKRQMISDVPLGAFLSGGIDSSTVVAFMQAFSNRTAKTFTIGFREKGYNEADDARNVARHLGTDHTELTCSADDALALVPRLPTMYDEPFADPSQLPTFLVSQLARRHVTVALSGDGGDEAFGGYVRYQGVNRLWRAARYLPRRGRHLVGEAIRFISPSGWDAITSVLPQRLQLSHFGDKITKGSALLDAADSLDMYRRLISFWPDPLSVVNAPAEADGWIDRRAAAADRLDTIAQLRLMDTMGYLPDDVLTKVDRASMACSLEVRVPLLDHRIIEFSWRLPSSRLISGGRGKVPLRAVLARHVPKSLIERPKMGFGVPIGQWMSGALREWAEDLLSPGALAADSLFDASIVRARFDEHISGKRNWQYALWSVLQFQAWRRAQY